MTYLLARSSEPHLPLALVFVSGLLTASKMLATIFFLSVVILSREKTKLKFEFGVVINLLKQQG